MEFEKKVGNVFKIFYFCVFGEFVCTCVGGDTFGYMWLYMEFLECIYEVFCKECIKSRKYLGERTEYIYIYIYIYIP